MNYRVANYIYLASLLFACISSIYRFRKLDAASKILAVLICCAFINESAASYMAKKYHNNLSLYTIYSFIEFGILCFYFNSVIDIFREKNLGIYVGVIGITLGIANLLFIQHLESINSYFLLLEGLCVIGMSLFAFFRLLLKNDTLNLNRYHHFWFISILIFFWSITFLSWGLYNYINERYFQSALNINIALAIVSTITYNCFAIVFLLYPKMQRKK